MWHVSVESCAKRKTLAHNKTIDPPLPMISTSPCLAPVLLLRIRLTIATLAAGLLAAGSYAQTPSAPSSTTDAKNDEIITLSPFVVKSDGDTGYLVTNSVSATRINAAIQDTPVAISVVTKALMDDIGAFDLKKALQYTAGVTTDPGITFQAYTSNQNAFTIRGLAGPAVFRDGFSALGLVETANMDRVEIVKGPASVYYGNASPGGLVNYVTKQPQARAFSAINIFAGSDDYYRGEIDINQPMSDNGDIAARLNASFVESHTFRRFERNSAQFYAPSLRARLGTDTTVTVNAEFYKTVKNEPRSIPFAYDKNANTLNPLTDIIARDWNQSGPDAYTHNAKTTLSGILDHAFNKNISTRLSLNYWTAETKALVEQSAQITFPENGLTLLRQPNMFHAEQTVYTIRNDWVASVNLLGAEHHFVGGLEHVVDDSYFTNRQSPAYANVSYNVLDFDSIPDPFFRIRAPYGDASYSLVFANTHTETTVNAIYVSDQVTAFNGRLMGLFGLRGDRINQKNLFSGVSASKSQPSPQASLLFKFTEQVAGYVSYSTSLVPNGLSTSGKLFEPQRGIGYEAGLKVQALDKRLLGTFSVFQIERQKIPTNVIFVDPVTGLATPQTLLVGAQQSAGWDMDLAFRLNDHWQTVASYSNFHAYVKQGRSGATASAVSPDEGLAASRAPRNQGSLWSKYSWGTAVRGASVGAGVVYSEEFVFTRAFLGNPSGKDTLGWAPGYVRYDISCDYRFKAGPTHVTLGFKLINALNQRYLDSGGGGAFLAPPRTFLANLSLKF